MNDVTVPDFAKYRVYNTKHGRFALISYTETIPGYYHAEFISKISGIKVSINDIDGRTPNETMGNKIGKTVVALGLGAAVLVPGKPKKALKTSEATSAPSNQEKPTETPKKTKKRHRKKKVASQQPATST